MILRESVFIYVIIYTYKIIQSSIGKIRVINRVFLRGRNEADFFISLKYTFRHIPGRITIINKKSYLK